MRQRDIFDPSTLDAPAIHVIGCGTIGSWTAFMLFKLGITKAHLWDFDIVEVLNIPSQLYTTNNVGLLKVEALGKMTGFEQHDTAFWYEEKFANDIFIMCVDSLVARREILAMLPPHVTVIDGRMGGEGYQVHVGTADSIEIPEFGSEDKCTAKGIVYVSAGVASHIVAAVKRILLGQEVDYVKRYVDYRGGSEIVFYK